MNIIVKPSAVGEREVALLVHPNILLAEDVVHREPKY